MSGNSSDFQTPLARVRGLGSSKHGVGHWWAQRLTAIALIPLALWFAYSVVLLAGGDYTAYRAWAGEHGNAMLLVLFVISMFHHAQLGLQVVIEDYIHDEAWKVGSIIAVKFVAAFCGVSSIIAVLRITFGS